LGKGWIVSVGAEAQLRGAFRGRFLGASIVLVGAGVAGMWSGDACVALAGEERRSWDEDEGDASVPALHHPNPRPYGYRGASEAT